MWRLLLIPQRYEFSSKSQRGGTGSGFNKVVVDTTKVRIFKQITTAANLINTLTELLLIPQRYEFSSKSQLAINFPRHGERCCWYHKGTNFQANHNKRNSYILRLCVVVDTTKVRIFKQITTHVAELRRTDELLLIPQRYEFSSKSQQRCGSKR